jgi:NitT/TauT family transport system permease protein
MRRKVEPILLPVVAAALLVALWHGAVRWSGTTVFPTPAAVARGLEELARKGLLFRYVRDSLVRVAGGFGAALALGIPVGVFLGWQPAAARAANPVIQFLRPISPLAWIPVAVVLFGVNDTAATFLIFLGSVFPILVATMNGVRGVPAIYRNAGRNFGLSRGALLARVVFPAALPELLGGIRIALGIAWLVVVAAEMIAVNSGLGYLVIDSRNAGKRYDLVVAAMVLIGVIGLALNVGVSRIARLRAVRWGARAEEA